MIQALLAQAVQTVDDFGGFKFIAVISALIITPVLMYLRDKMKDARERDADLDRNKTLERIAVSNESMRDNMAGLTTHLCKQEAVQNERHINNLEAIRNLHCRAEYNKQTKHTNE
jgi:hypothetical protein